MNKLLVFCIQYRPAELWVRLAHINPSQVKIAHNYQQLAGYAPRTTAIWLSINPEYLSENEKDEQARCLEFMKFRRYAIIEARL